jgi:hypothetical protein
MAFKLNKNPTFVATATIAVPTDNGPQDETISVRFRVLPDEALELPSPEFLKRAILRIDDVLDDAGEPVASSEQLIAEVLALPFTRLPLVRAYMTALTGARAGN